MIAHRLSTVRDADLIVVLESGRLVEAGTHDELMARQGLYYYLASQQLRALRRSASRGVQGGCRTEPGPFGPGCVLC